MQNNDFVFGRSSILENDKKVVEKLKKYRKSGNKNIRNEIITSYIWLADYYASLYAKRFNIDSDELKSYAYEVIIKVVDKFDENGFVSFFEYCTNALRNNLMKSIAKLQGINGYSDSFFRKVGPVIEKVEDDFGVRLEDNIDLILDVKKRLLEDDKASRTRVDEVIRHITTNLKISLEEYEESFEVVDNYTFCGVEYELLKKTIDKALECLPKRLEMVIRMYYGLTEDGKKYGTSEIAGMLGCTLQNVFYIRSRALQVLLDNNSKKILEGYLDIFESYMAEVDNVKVKSKSRVYE